MIPELYDERRDRQAVRDVEEDIQLQADEIAEEKYGREFYELPKQIQYEVWEAAEAAVKESLSSHHDAIYERIREERMGLRK